ncbi:hypothetical protein J6590_000789 [Homalodisca vitripennis]|nr:hypothetical protein J6590_000789 [Homalodisca vitripennis]
MKPRSSFHLMHPRKRSDTLGLEYDAWCNVPTLTLEMLKDQSLNVLERDCTNDQCVKEKRTIINVVEANSNVIFNEGISAMAKAVLVSLHLCTVNDDFSEQLANTKYFIKEVCGRQCSGKATVSCTMSPFLIVDVEFLSNKDVGMLVESSGNCRPYALNEFPSQLVLCGKKFTIMGVVAYTHRLDNRWEVLDDLANEIVICNESERISPILSCMQLHVKVQIHNIISCTIL